MARRTGKAGRNIATYEHPDKERVNNPPVGLVTPETVFTSSLSSSGYTPTCIYDFEFQGREFKCGSKSWRTHRQGMEQLIRADRIMAPGRLPTFVQFHDDFAVQPLHNLWTDTHGATDLRYAVQMSVKVVQRCLLMATDPGDLVFDPTCGSGTTAYVAEQWGRRWITCDTSRFAITLVFAAFQFDPEASKDIDETSWPGVTLLKAHMNADLLTDDLKKKRASNESFWLIGQPDVALEPISEGEDEGKFRVSVRGFDYYNTKTGNVESGNADKIALWMLDPNYDCRSLFPCQVFFPMAGTKDGWAKLAKSLKAEIDETRMAAYRGTVSLPFEPGEHRRAAVKIVDDRGVESLKIVELR